jgi:adenylate cyclase
VEIDPRYGLSWCQMGFSQYNLRRGFGRSNDGGAAALAQALALNPDLAEARALNALLLYEAGQGEAAAAEIAVALRLDPESVAANNAAANTHYRDGRLAEAVPYFEKAVAVDDAALSHPMLLVSCYTALGDQENARRIARIALERAERVVANDRSNGHAMCVGSAALAVLGEAVRAKDWMRRALLVDPDNLNMRYNFACTLAALSGDPEAALAMLEPVLERGTDGTVKNARIDPDLARLRGDPRFQAMLAAAEARLAAAKPADDAGTPASA